MNKYKKQKFTAFFIFIVVLVLFLFVFFSNSFEREKPVVNIADTIYWNTLGKIDLQIEDNVAIKNIKVEFSKNDEKEKNTLINQSVNTKSANLNLELAKPKFNEKIEKYVLYISVRDASLWNWFMGNESKKVVNVIIDNKRPTVNVLTNSYSITQGGAASVVFYAQDDNLEDLYIQANNHTFKVFPFYKENYYIALIAWDLKDDDYEAKIIASDKAGNITKEHIRLYLQNRKYRVSNIKLNGNFIDGKIADLFNMYSSQNSESKEEIFDFVNSTLRLDNEKIIHKITSNLDLQMISDFSLKPFAPLRNGKKVADFGDHRFYSFNSKDISQSYHLGLDLASTKMAPINLSNSGKVVFAEENGIYGLNLIIDHGLGLFSLYGHCSKKNVELGDIVSANQSIANTGTSGLALGDHLHFGMLVQGIEVRPEEWMDAKWMRDNVFNIIKSAKDIINGKKSK